jgi:ferredoxin
MPSKYMIHTRPVAARMKPITKTGIIAWEEGCLKCAVCVKKRCVYKVYDRRGLDAKQMLDSIDNECMNCLRCVQGCPKELIHKSISPEYKEMGDGYWTPEIISKLWYQAETGKIPVSGAGYPGRFSGPGFDTMWTDMSEIVRPTRDGIHGREYISTAIDLGKTPSHLDARRMEQADLSMLIDIPLPILLRVPSFGAYGRNTLRGWAMAAKHLGTFLTLGDADSQEGLSGYRSWLIPQSTVESLESGKGRVRNRIVEAVWTPGITEMDVLCKTKSLVSIRLPVAEGVEEKVTSLARMGVPIIHLAADDNGESLDQSTLFVKDAVRKSHLALLDAGIRDEVTLLASGGLSMAEHVAKTIICGADGVFVDLPLLISLGCRMCRRCTRGLPCPADIEGADSPWVAGRVINMMAAWHNQLLEMMGAMGIRDVRRLRGETGRAMFFEDLDEATFGDLGKVEDGCELE